jgi:hypothetical protein
MENSSQWTNLLKHLGVWQGSFTRLSPQGNLIEDLPTIVSLEGLNHNQTIRQIIQKFPPDRTEIVTPTILEYSTLNRSILLFENGAFSIGSMQFSPVSSFGVEIGFIQENYRLRLVSLFNEKSELSEFTLIREHEQKVQPLNKPHLQVEQLLGEWQGEATTIYADWRNPTQYPTHLSLKQEDHYLIQNLSAPNFSLTSRGKINGSIINFDEGKTPMQVLLLPDGASANTPVKIPHRQSFLIEAGWLISERQRWRLIRQYNDQGTWVSLTLIMEQKL